MIDIFVNTAIVTTIASILNFCNEQSRYFPKKLKFLKKMPLNNLESHKLSFGQMTVKLDK